MRVLHDSAEVMSVNLFSFVCVSVCLRGDADMRVLSDLAVKATSSLLSFHSFTDPFIFMAVVHPRSFPIYVPCNLAVVAGET